MGIKDLLAGHQEQIKEKWIEAVNSTYPFGTIGFLRAQNNPFVNPVGERNREAAAALVQSFLDDTPNQEELSEVIEEFIRVRAIQDFSAEDAFGIVYALKPIIYDILGDKLDEHAKARGLGDIRWLDSHIDALVLLAFGAYCRCRDKLADMRVDDFKRRHSQIIRQAERVLNQKFPEHRLK